MNTSWALAYLTAGGTDHIQLIIESGVRLNISLSYQTLDTETIFTGGSCVGVYAWSL